MRIWYCPAFVMYLTHFVVWYWLFSNTFRLRTCSPDAVNMGTWNCT